MTEQTLKATVQSDLHDAMRARDKVRSGALRMALTPSPTRRSPARRPRELSDDEVLKVLAKEAKKRKEAATAYRDAGHPDRAEAEEAERCPRGLPPRSARRRGARGAGGAGRHRDRSHRHAADGPGREGRPGARGRPRGRWPVAAAVKVAQRALTPEGRPPGLHRAPPRRPAGAPEDRRLTVGAPTRCG